MGFPEAIRILGHGQPSYKSFGKFLTRLRSEDDSVVSAVSLDEREVLVRPTRRRSTSPITTGITLTCWRG